MVAPLLLFGLGAAGTYALDRAERAKAAQIADERRRALGNAIQMSGMLGQEPSPRILGGARPGPTMNAWQGLPREQQVSGVMRHLANAGYGDEVQKYILEQRLKPKTAPNPVTINGQLVDPRDGRVIGDYRTPETVEPNLVELYDTQAKRTKYFDVNSPEVQAAMQSGRLTSQAPTASPAKQFEEETGGKVEAGTMPVKDEQTGKWSLQPIPGSEKDPVVVEEERVAALKAEQPRAFKAMEAAMAPMNVMLDAIGRVRGEDKEDGTPTLTESARAAVGPISQSPFGRLGRYTDANIATAFSDVDFLRNSAQVQGLQLMRNASRTGGAVGQVTEREWPKVEALIGNLDPSQGEESYARQLAAVEAQMRESIEVIRQAYVDEFGPVMETSEAPDGVDPEVWDVMTPDERALWTN